ncbi:isovaleryl-CoA dehydrogenase [Breoghania sp.]|uniref:isovaleryl-CoA dehydrogenase n=1 Tax=Breoghania sp. TaxID=2065378 RepID=UPI0029C9D2A8|nr:isovaleryl-CoA dehydrogenase [Breoghania sp.]
MDHDPGTTHEVFNQTPPFAGRNLFSGDPVLRSALDALLDPQTEEDLTRAGAYWGSTDALEMARLANSHTPTLRTHDAQGRRLDTVEFHPAYHALMRRSVEGGLHCSAWDGDPTLTGRRHALRAARLYMTAQGECGHLCPMTMTNAAIAALKLSPELLETWLPRIVSRRYDYRFLPADQKAGVTIGMGMTEKQGGTDVRANTTRAEPGDDGMWRITGHKWFFSAPMCDAFLVLAQTQAGPTCFLMPRFLPDGSVNRLRLQRLKDKLGNRSNASSEVEFHGAGAWLVGEEGRGVATILEMVTMTRLDCALASAGQMRAALGEAVHHARHRQVFGAKLIDQPMMTRVLADMALDVAAATALTMRLARAFDHAPKNEREALFARLVTPAAKYWVCKATPALVYEAMECLGGNGYVEESPMARLYREAPLDAIWEGAGNVMCLDVLRALQKQPQSLDAVIGEVERDLGSSGPVSSQVLKAAARACVADPGSSRILTEQLALTVAAACLRQVAPRAVADAFIDTRLGGQWRATYGMLDSRFDAKALVEYAFPES